MDFSWFPEFFCKYWFEIVFGLIVAGVSFVARKVYKNINKRLEDEKKRNEAIENGMRDMLRLTILDNYERCMSDGYISVSRKDALDSAYKSYHELGGNGTITKVHEEIMDMPILKEKEQKK